MGKEEELQAVIFRIQKMEGYLDEISKAMLDCNKSIKNNAELKRMLQELIDYYENGQWLKDYEYDERGELPKDLKRGVLAQDTLYNLISELETFA